MAKNANQKLKIIYLLRILMENTDENHSMTMAEIISALEAYGVSAERKSIYSDIESLRVLGIDILHEQRNKTHSYYIGSRDFELAELKLLVDSVQASKFITHKKSNELIKKIEGLASKYEAKELQRQVYVTERVKTLNEKIYYLVDDIHTAINQNVKIRFQYFQWNEKKEQKIRKGGAFYCISPWALTWADDNYYMIGYDKEADTLKHYRVDKMLNISLTDEKREGKAAFRELDIAVYTKKIFGMFDGEDQYVKLKVHNSLAGVIIDRFGTSLPFIKADSEHFTVNVNVAVSRQFLAWVIALGNKVKILEPQSVVEKMREEAKRLSTEYLSEK